MLRSDNVSQCAPYLLRTKKRRKGEDSSSMLAAQIQVVKKVRNEMWSEAKHFVLKCSRNRLTCRTSVTDWSKALAS